MARAKLAVICAAIFPLTGGPLSAQELTLQPVTSYLTSSVDSSDYRYVARRCAALFLILSNQSRERGETGIANTLSTDALIFLMVARQADIRMGTPEADANSVTLAATQDVMKVLRDRMKRNMALTGSYISGDALLESDVKTCRELSEKLAPSGPAPEE